MDSASPGLLASLNAAYVRIAVNVIEAMPQRAILMFVCIPRASVETSGASRAATVNKCSVRAGASRDSSSCPFFLFTNTKINPRMAAKPLS